MESDITLNAPSSVILAEGKRRSPFGFWTWIALGLCAFFLFLLGAFWLALSRDVKIPTAPSALISISPGKLKTASPKLVAALPSDLRSILKTDSNWPITIGFYKQASGWSWFAVMPRWMEHGQATIQDTAGLTKVVGALTETTKSFSYTDQFAWHGLLTNPLAFQIDPSFLAELVGLSPENDWPSVTGRLEDDLLITDLPSKALSDQNALKGGDISINMGTLLADDPVSNKFTQSLSNLYRNLGLPTPLQWSVWLHTDGKVAQSQVIFSEKLSAPQASALLGAHGFSMRRIVQLPDESLGVERVAPYATSTADLVGRRSNPHGEEIELTEQSLRVTQPNTHEPIFEAVPNCGPFFKDPSLLLSSQALELLLSAQGAVIDIPKDFIFYAGRAKNRLALCISS